MVKTAMEETQIQTRKNRGVNCPDNHNLQGDKAKSKIVKILREENSLSLSSITNDFVLPPKSVMIGTCRKKNQSFGSETRHLMLGTTQLLLARDKSFESIVNVIPLEGGYCMVRAAP